MLVKFRVTLEFIKENIDVVQFFNQLGTGLFLVLHKKPGNYHYHGLLDITTTARTFREKIKEILCPLTTVAHGGLRSFSVGEKVDDVDRYKSYCMYRTGHPIDAIYVKEEIEDLGPEPKNDKKELKQEVDLRELLHLVKDEKTPKEITKMVLKFYKDNFRVIHITKIQQLVHTILMHINDDIEDLAEHILFTDDALRLMHNKTIDKFDGRVHDGYPPPDFVEPK